MNVSTFFLMKTYMNQMMRDNAAIQRENRRLARENDRVRNLPRAAIPVFQPRRVGRVDPAQEQRVRDRFYVLNAFFETRPSSWPQPGDYNWMYRVTDNKIPPQETPEDYLKLRDCDMNTRIKMAVVIFNYLRVATSTVLYDFNVTGLNLHAYLTQQLVSPSFDTLVNNFLLTPRFNDGMNALLFDAVISFIRETTNRNVPARLFWKQCWNTRPNIDTNIINGRGPHLVWMNNIPEHPDVLSIDSYIDLRPVEWAITISAKKMDPSRLVQSKQPNITGVYSRARTPSYDKAMSKSYPFVTQMYGPTMLNMIGQGWFGEVNWPQIRYEVCKWNYGTVSNFNIPDVQPVPKTYNNYHELNFFKPLLIMLYEHFTEEVIAPFIKASPANMSVFDNIRDSCECEPPIIGLCDKPAVDC